MSKNPNFSKWGRCCFASVLMMIVVYLLLAMLYMYMKKRIPIEYLPNSTMVKLEAIFSGEVKKTSFIMGSSRVGALHPKRNKWIEEYYLLNVASSAPCIYLRHIKWLLYKHVAIKNILIGVDNISYLSGTTPVITYVRKMPYAYLIDYYREYLLFQIKLPEALIGFFLSKAGKNIHYDKDTGARTEVGQDEWIEKHQQQHRCSPDFEKLPKINYGADKVDLAISDIKDIVDICRENNIHLTIFINPMHGKVYRHLDKSKHYRFLKKLAGVTDFYDFSGVNHITTDNYYYYETNHYRPLVGDMIVKRLFEKEKIKQTDFGFYCTSKNINAHVNSLRKSESKASQPQAQ